MSQENRAAPPTTVVTSPHVLGTTGGMGRWRHFFGLLTGYFVSRHWLIAWTLLALVLLMTFGGVRSLVALIDWQKSLFDAMSEHDYPQLPRILRTFLFITAWTVGTSVLGDFVEQMLQIQWRTWLTGDYTRRYLEASNVYAIEQDGLVDNPDQRISDDINLLLAPVVGIVGTFIGFIRCVTGVISYSMVLARVSRPIVFSIVGHAVSLPYDFVIYCFAYSALSYGLIYLAGQPLVRRTIRQQKVEADFRFRLGGVRRAAEQIAFFRAGPAEGRKLQEVFGRVRRNLIRLLLARLGVASTQGVIGAFSDLLPLAAALPRYFSGAITLGDVAGLRLAFSSLQSSLSWFVQAYPQIAVLTAVVTRLYQLDQEIAKPRVLGIAVTRGGALPAVAEDLRLTLATGEALVELDSWCVRKGQRWAVRGPSGAGKTTLLRAIAGLWRHGSGRVVLGEGRVMFVPQRLYTPAALLKEVLAFPNAADDFSDGDAAEALVKVRLSALAPELRHCRNWGDELSPGEQQRLAIARIVLHRPDILFLDEATSALDRANAAAMYELLQRELPDLTLVSVIHDPMLVDAHDHFLEVCDGKARVVAPTV